MDPTEAQMLADLAARRAARAEACQAALATLLSAEGCTLEAVIEIEPTGMRACPRLSGAAAGQVRPELDRILAMHHCVLEAKIELSSLRGYTQQVQAVART